MLSISFRNDELKRIDELMSEYSLNRHGVIKLAVRRFLFPYEKTVPLDGKKPKCTFQSQKQTGSSQKQDQYDIFEDEPAQNETEDQTPIPPFLEEKEDDLWP